MGDFSKSRRRMLLGTARWVGGAVAVAATGAARPAHAFQSYVGTPESGVGQLYANRCGPSSEHAALTTELQGKLEHDPALPSLTAFCPLCGCPVTVAR